MKRMLRTPGSNPVRRARGRRAWLAAATAILVQAATMSEAVAAPVSPADPAPTASTPPPPSAETTDPGRRNDLLGKGWRESGDRMWTTTGDATGFHVLVAEASSGYTWRTAATLNQQGVETDMWIGNACVTGSGKQAVVVYAPRTYTNKTELFARGGFTAVVDLVSGVVKKLELRTSLAYFNPGCGTGDEVTLTQGGDQDLGKTRIRTLDAGTGRISSPIDVPGQLTSPIPTKHGIVAADKDAVVAVDKRGRRTVLADATGVPFDLQADSADGVVFMEHLNASARVRRSTPGARRDRRARTITLATGRLGKMDVSVSAAGKTFITGQPDTVSALPATVAKLDVPVDTAVSTRGEAAVTSVQKAGNPDPRIQTAGPDTAVPVDVDAVSIKTGRPLAFTVDPGDSVRPRSVPDDPGRYCAVPRNDPKTQVYQPKPKQVEWAANMAVKGHLTITREKNWKNNGLESYTPQGLFPPVPLRNTTNGQVPAQVFLGILGQESNMWQASPHVIPGETGNPLIGNYYGVNESGDAWTINWDKADCGYGVSQMTDGMRRPEHNRPGEKALSWTKQKAIATDYAANIAAGLQLLQGKWNELQVVNMRVNDNNPAKIENWFFTAWAYNAGYHNPGEKGAGDAYGLGWGNNPANPNYNPTRHSFGSDPADFAKPNKWPYPEKVMGFAANPPSALESPNTFVPFFRPAWWPGLAGAGVGSAVAHRDAVRPPPYQFCTKENSCEWGKQFTPNYPGDGAPGSDVRGEPAGPCAHRNGTYYDLKCWWHAPTTWKPDCNAQCGNEFIRYDYPTYAAEPEDGSSYPPKCGTQDLPLQTLVVDDVASDVPAVSKRGCPRPGNAGEFSFTFGKDDAGRETSKIDLHQVGGGFGAHFWFAHTRRNDPARTVTGTWAFNKEINGWARVFVHLPDHGAHTRQAKYVVNLGNGTRFRVQPQRIRENRWMSLGSFPFAGKPKITLSTVTADGTGNEDVAWDAAAIVPLPGKPKQVIAALGDSYSSGEGASEPGGGNYYKETDVDGDDKEWRNACHRSNVAWSRLMTLRDSTTAVGVRSDKPDSDIDYHMVACSGAQTHNLLPDDGTTNAFGKTAQAAFSEVPQLESGYVDQDTTLVTLSIGGNDSRFADVIEHCIYKTIKVCQDVPMEGDSAPLKDVAPELITGKVRSSIHTVLRKIHQRAPNAKIVLVGYPLLFAGTGVCALGIGGAEAPWLNEMGATLNQQMALVADDLAVAGLPVRFADPSTAFAGKSICGDPEQVHGYVTKLTPGDSPHFKLGERGVVSAQSFHPKIGGSAIYAEVVTSTLRGWGL